MHMHLRMHLRGVEKTRPNVDKTSSPPSAPQQRSSSVGPSQRCTSVRLQGHSAPVAQPTLLAVLYANVVVFLYTLPINALSIALLYGVTTMALSEMVSATLPARPSHSRAAFRHAGGMPCKGECARGHRQHVEAIVSAFEKS